MLTINHQPYEPSEDKRLLDFLRNDLRLCSVKDGCSEGACGTCTVLVDGRAVKACLFKLSKLEGKSVLTVEGLSVREKAVYAYAFGQAGAVQCGFCIPGMVLCAKALLGQNPEPSLSDVKKAIRGNICRCTGYKKIEHAILLAARLLRDGQEVPPLAESGKIGELFTRVDAEEKVLGTGLFADDLTLPGMVYASAVRSRYPRAIVKRISTERALAHPDTIRVLRAEDVPFNKTGHLIQDWDVLIRQGDATRYVGDAIVLVISRHKESLSEIKELVEIEYEELRPVTSPMEALSEGAPILHEGGNLLSRQELRRGDVDKAFREAAHIVTHHYSTPMTDHAFMEPECAIAEPQPDGGLLLHTASQSVYDEQKEIARMLGLPPEKVRSQTLLVGGGFGGKEDMSVQHHAALITYVTGLPVKVKLSRAESLLIHPKRHPFWMDFTMGCDENGIIQGVRAKVVSDTGAFASLGGPVLERACTHAAGPYAYENFEIEGTAYYTNNPPAGAFRGFGVTQTCFAVETLLNEMADKVGITPWEIRLRNAIRPGGVLPNGQIVGPETGLVETLEAVRPYYDAAVKAGKPVGLACAMKNAGVGVGLPDYGRCKLIVEADEKLHIYSGASCIGQGLGTVLVQMTVTNTPLRREQIVYERSNTWIAPDSGDTSGSRQTLITGEACRRACELFTAALEGKTMHDLIGQEFYGEYYAKTDPLGANKPNPVSHVAYGYATQMCVLNPKTGKIESLVAAHDVGKAVNPKSCEGQIEGGVVMSMGYALREQYPIDENCKPIEKYGQLGLFRAHEIPKIVPIVVDKPGLNVACGAIGIGEITSIPTAPAIADAYFRLDGERRTRLPLADTPYERKA